MLQTRLAALELKIDRQDAEGQGIRQDGFQRLSTVEERVAQMNKLWWALVTGLLLNLALNGWQAYKLAQGVVVK